MRRPSLTLFAVTAAALLLVACGDAGMTSPEINDELPPDEVPETPDDTEDGLEDGMEDGSEGQVDADLAAEVDQALTDAAADSGVAEGDIEVVLAEQVTWSDGAIGCPEPDGMYTQALVEGYRIVLRVDGEEVAYHGADGQPPFRCDDPIAPVDDADTM